MTKSQFNHSIPVPPSLSGSDNSTTTQLTPAHTFQAQLFKPI